MILIFILFYTDLRFIRCDFWSPNETGGELRPLRAECGVSGVWSYFITNFQSFFFELLRLRRFSLARGQCDATPRG